MRAEKKGNPFQNRSFTTTTSCNNRSGSFTDKNNNVTSSLIRVAALPIITQSMLTYRIKNDEKEAQL